MAAGIVPGCVPHASGRLSKGQCRSQAGSRSPEAKTVAKQLQIHKVQPMTAEVSGVSNGAKVSVVVGEDNAPAEG